MRPLEPDKLKGYLHRKAEEQYKTAVASHAQRGLLAGTLQKMLDGETSSRYAVCKWLTGETSSSNIPGPLVFAMMDWLAPYKDNTAVSAKWTYSEDAEEEARRVLREALKDEGQMELI